MPRARGAARSGIVGRRMALFVGGDFLVVNKSLSDLVESFEQAALEKRRDLEARRQSELVREPESPAAGLEVGSAWLIAVICVASFLVASSEHTARGLRCQGLEQRWRCSGPIGLATPAALCATTIPGAPQGGRNVRSSGSGWRHARPAWRGFNGGGPGGCGAGSRARRGRAPGRSRVVPPRRGTGCDGGRGRAAGRKLGPCQPWPPRR